MRYDHPRGCKIRADTFLLHNIILSWKCPRSHVWNQPLSSRITCPHTLRNLLLTFRLKNYTPQRWQQFLIYIGYNLVAFLINAFLNSSLNNVNKAALTWSITGFVLISITVLACASPNYSSADFVFRQFANETGWPDGIAWLLGVMQLIPERSYSSC